MNITATQKEPSHPHSKTMKALNTHPGGGPCKIMIVWIFEVEQGHVNDGYAVL